MTSTDSPSRFSASTASRSGSYTPLPKVLRIFWVGSITAFALFLLIAYLQSHKGISHNGWNPLNDPFLEDLIINRPSFKLLHSAEFFHNPSSVAYPPFSAVVLGMMYSAPHPLELYAAIFIAALATAILYVRRLMIDSGINPITATLFPLSLALITFPVEGLFQRGNIELFLWIFAAAGIWAYLRDHNDAAAILWAFAAAMKLYPVIFLILLIPRHKFRALFLGVLSFFSISLLSMMYLGPNISTAFWGSLRNTFGYQGVRAAEWSFHELAANHSFFGLVRLVALILGHSSMNLTLPYYLTGAVVMAIAFFGRIRNLPIANQVLTVSVFMVMLPSVSYFYTLVHLYAPWLILIFIAIRAHRAGKHIEGLELTIMLFLPLFASFTLFTFRSLFLFGGLIQAFFLLLLFLSGLQYPFAEPVPSE